jgi:hypothetical protein
MPVRTSRVLIASFDSNASRPADQPPHPALPGQATRAAIDRGASTLDVGK